MSAKVSPSASFALEPRTADRRGELLPVVSATGGDHPAIYHFLTDVFQGPSRAEYKASLEDPFYEPLDRLLVKAGRQIVAHLHVGYRVMQLGCQQLPVAGLGWLATLPEFRGQGHATRLLAAADRQMLRDGALAGLLRTSIPHFFRRLGWALCGRHSYCRAGARAVLSEFLAGGFPARRCRRLSIRPWRRVELAVLMQLYDQNLADTHGRLQRTETYWEWLIRRHAYDQIYVAQSGRPALELAGIHPPIVGYAFVRGDTIVELLTAPGWEVAAAELLARVCGDTIEHGHHSVTLHAPPDHPLHRLFQRAGGVHHCHESGRGEVFMARLPDPVNLLRLLSGELSCRAEAAGLPRPLDLGLLVDGMKYCLQLARQGATVVAHKLGRSYLRLNVADFTRLILGQLDWDRALSQRRLEASTGLALEAGRALFPQTSFWRPPLDDLQA